MTYSATSCAPVFKMLIINFFAFCSDFYYFKHCIKIAYQDDCFLSALGFTLEVSGSQ